MSGVIFVKLVDVSDLWFVFGGNVMKLLFLMVDILMEFKWGGMQWNNVVDCWFFQGLLEGIVFVLKDGIDIKVVLCYVGIVFCLFELKYEYKEVGVVYLMSFWFDSVFILREK